MICIYCGKKLAVTNSRIQKKQNSVWRRRRCLSCGALFTTSERIDLSKTMIIKRSESLLEPFSREKMQSSIYESCKHRSAPESDAESLTNTIVNQLLKQSSHPSIELSELKKVVMSTLSRFDSAAATHYKAYFC